MLGQLTLWRGFSVLVGTCMSKSMAKRGKHTSRQVYVCLFALNRSACATHTAYLTPQGSDYGYLMESRKCRGGGFNKG